MSYSVVIPSRNLANLEKCLHALTLSNFTGRIVVVDDFDPPLEPLTIPNLKWIRGIKPFVWARNINLGIDAAGSDDVVLMNDDAILETYRGFEHMAEAGRRDRFGVVSAAIRGGAAAPDQLLNEGKAGTWPVDHHMVAFICVFIRRQVLELVGPLDERFTDYGYDDDDYCHRVKIKGYDIGCCQDCVVEHGELSSTFRSPLYRGIAGPVTLQANLERFQAKWGGTPAEVASRL